MKLYFAPGTCSLSPHIVAHELGFDLALERVDLREKRTAGGADYRAINPKGHVPALALDDGQILTEGPAIVQYLADQRPDAGLAPPHGTMERYRLIEWLNCISSEIHKGFGPLFSPKTPDALKQAQKEQLGGRFDFLSRSLEGKSFLLGDAFSVADAYLFTVLRWTKAVDMDLGKWPVLTAYVGRIRERPSVKAAFAAEAALK